MNWALTASGGRLGFHFHDDILEDGLQGGMRILGVFSDPLPALAMAWLRPLHSLQHLWSGTKPVCLFMGNAVQLANLPGRLDTQGQQCMFD